MIDKIYLVVVSGYQSEQIIYSSAELEKAEQKYQFFCSLFKKIDDKIQKRKIRKGKVDYTLIQLRSKLQDKMGLQFCETSTLELVELSLDKVKTDNGVSIQKTLKSNRNYTEF